MGVAPFPFLLEDCPLISASVAILGMVPQGSKIQSIISVAGHQVIRNLSEPSDFTFGLICRLSEADGATHRVEGCAGTTNDGWPSLEETSWTLPNIELEVYGPYQVMLNVDGISIYTRTYVTTDDDQMGQIYMREEELKVRRIGHDAMMEQDAVHYLYEADVSARLLDTNGTKIGVTGSLET